MMNVSSDDCTDQGVGPTKEICSFLDVTDSDQFANACAADPTRTLNYSEGLDGEAECFPCMLQPGDISYAMVSEGEVQYRLDKKRRSRYDIL